MKTKATKPDEIESRTCNVFITKAFACVFDVLHIISNKQVRMTRKNIVMKAYNTRQDMKRSLCSCVMIIYVIMFASTTCSALSERNALEYTRDEVCQDLRDHLDHRKNLSNGTSHHHHNHTNLKCMLVRVPSSKSIEGTRSSEFYDTRTGLYVYESTVSVDIPVALTSLAVNATIKTRDFVESEITLIAAPAKPTTTTTTSGTNDNEVEKVLLVHDDDGDDDDGLSSQKREIILKSLVFGGRITQIITGDDYSTDYIKAAWTSQYNKSDDVEYNKGLQDALDFLHNNTSSTRRSSDDHEKQDEGITEGLNALVRGKRSRPEVYAGNGGSLGTWTLRMASPRPKQTNLEASGLEDWSLEMCFDAEANYPSLCTNNTEMVVAMSRRGSRRRGSRPSAYSSAAQSQSTYCLPGFRFLCSARANRMQDEMKCVESGYSLNPFTRMAGRYCCKKSRVFFWRHWWRKTFTGRCRRFFR